MTVIAHLHDPAFQALLIAGIETFPSGYLPTRPGKREDGVPAATQPCEGEALGLLFGQRVLKDDLLVFTISLVVPMQTAERSKGMVCFSDRHFNRIREVMEAFPSIEFLGSFHSHPWKAKNFRPHKAVEYSKADVVSALEIANDYGEEILEVILGITADGRRSRERGRASGAVIASSIGRMRYSLAAYCTLRKNQRKRRQKGKRQAAGQLLPVDRLICPLALQAGGLVSRFRA